jgi:hypothetical protein
MEYESFDARADAIQAIIDAFHSEFLKTNTESTYNTTVLRSVFKKINYIHDALTTFLSQCLNNEIDCAGDAPLLNQYPTSVDAAERQELIDATETLLQDLCGYMVPWHPDMNSRVTHIFSKFISQPFSLNDRVDGKSPEKDSLSQVLSIGETSP